jgi:hypothetical protein
MIVRCLMCDGQRKVKCFSNDPGDPGRIQKCEACDGLGFQLLERKNVVNLVRLINDPQGLGGKPCGLEHFVRQFEGIGPDDPSWLGPDDDA